MKRFLSLIKLILKMINKKDFEVIRKNLGNFENEREKTIQDSREIIKLSKQIIYSVHRDDMESASGLMSDIKKKIRNLSKGCYDTNINMVAFQEYVEAVCYFEFIKSNKIPTLKEVGVDTESYLLGLCDLTGELVRKAVDDIIKKKFDHALQIKELVAEIYGEFLTFDLRNGDLRTKFDSIKWNLNKLEDLILSAELRK